MFSKFSFIDITIFTQLSYNILVIMCMPFFFFRLNRADNSSPMLSKSPPSARPSFRARGNYAKCDDGRLGNIRQLVHKKVKRNL